MFYNMSEDEVMKKSQKTLKAFLDKKITIKEALDVYKEINLRKDLQKDSDKEKREK